MASIPSNRPITAAVFAADVWEHVCPMIRLVEPFSGSGIQLIKGNEFVGSSVQIYPTALVDADLVVITRDFPRHIDEYERIIQEARKLKKPIIYEIDDLLIDLAIVHPDIDVYLEARPAILRGLLDADAVTVSTTSLGEVLRPYNPNIYRLPNFLADTLWNLKPPKHEPSSKITIGYMGGHGHLPDVEMIYPVLERMLERYPETVSLKFWGLRPSDELLNRPNVSWTHPYLLSYAAFAEYFYQQDCDIFIAPLLDHTFNRCKSGLKFLEYSALGIPGVYSDLPPFNELITDGKNGFLAATTQDWEKHLVRLIEDRDLRIRMATEAQISIKQSWLLSQNAYRWHETYAAILSDGAHAADASERATFVIQKTQKWHNELVKKSAHLRQEISQIQAKSAGLEAESPKTLAEKTRLEKTVLKLSRLPGENELLRMELLKKERENLEVTARLAEFESNPSWKLFLRTRMALAPVSSLRGRLLSFTISALRTWRSKGLRAFLAVVKNRLNRTPRGAPIQSPSITDAPEISIFPVAGMICARPAISVIELRSEDTYYVDSEAVGSWLKKQTWREWEWLIWDRRSSKFWTQGHEEQFVSAGEVEDFIDLVSGKYFCIVSPDLLLRKETYLEENLLALESEGLAFTLNLNAKSEWVKGHLENGRYAGSKEAPLSRMVVNTRCLKDDFEVDLSLWIARQSGRPTVVGRVISHTTNELELEGLLEFNRSFENTTIRQAGPHLIAEAPFTQFNDLIFHPIHPVESVLPILEEPSEKPTVILYMPFLAVGGAERVALDVIRCLKDEIRFIVLAMDPHDPAIGNMVDSFRELTPYVYTAHDFLNAALNFSMAQYLLYRFHPGTFYIANGSPWIYDALSAIKSYHPEMRIVNQVYDHEAGWINRYDPELTKILNANIGSNPKICAAFLEKGAQKETIFQIENGVNTAELDPALYSPERIRSIKQKMNLSLEAKIVVFMARLHPQKRPMDFVEVARRCQDDPNLHFLMVGDGALGKAVDDTIAQIGLRNITHVSFYRPGSDIYAIADVLVLPSEYEGMPMVVVETMAMGKGVVVTDVGNNREVLEITHGGILVSKIGDIGALKDGILKTLAAPPDPAALRKAVVEHFSLEIMSEKYRLALLGK